MGKYFLNTKSTFNYVYEVEADSVESAIEVYKKAEYRLCKSEIVSNAIISVSQCEDKDTPIFCDHCGTKLTEGTMNYVGTMNGKKFYICNKCLDKTFTNEEWESLIDLLSRV